jgi:hypothetical protein
VLHPELEPSPRPADLWRTLRLAVADARGRGRIRGWSDELASSTFRPRCLPAAARFQLPPTGPGYDRGRPACQEATLAALAPLPFALTTPAARPRRRPPAPSAGRRRGGAPQLTDTSGSRPGRSPRQAGVPGG